MVLVVESQWHTRQRNIGAMSEPAHVALLQVQRQRQKFPNREGQWQWLVGSYLRYLQWDVQNCTSV